MNMNELWNDILISVKKSYQDAITIADADGVTQTCAGSMRTTIEGLVRLFYLKYYRREFNRTFRLGKSINNEEFRRYFTGAEYSDIDSIRFVGNDQVHFMFDEKISDEDIVKTFKRAVQALQNKLKVDITPEISAKENEKERNFQEKWNSIVRKYNEHRSFSETVVQRDWEAIISEILGYKRVNDEIRSQFLVHIGAGQRLIPDVVVSKNSKDLFVAEFKQYKLPFSSEMKEQIISYFNQLHIAVGILVCAKLYLYSYDYPKNRIVQLEIPFEESNGNGIQFVELFSRENYDESKIRAFIEEKSESILHTAETQGEAKNPTNFNTVGLVNSGKTFLVRTNAELLNEILGTNYKAYMKCHKSLTGDHQYDLVMLPEGKVISGWINTFEEPTAIWHEDFVGSPDEKLPEHEGLPSPYRAFFKKCGDGALRSYVFCGVYELSDKSTPDHRINIRISETEDFSRYSPPNKPYHKL